MKLAGKGIITAVVAVLLALLIPSAAQAAYYNIYAADRQMYQGELARSPYEVTTSGGQGKVQFSSQGTLRITYYISTKGGNSGWTYGSAQGPGGGMIYLSHTPYDYTHSQCSWGANANVPGTAATSCWQLRN